MTAPSNSASLEDCHTNLFLLTELNGLHWARYGYDLNKFSHLRGVGGIGSFGPHVRHDPILAGYAKCLHEGLLVAWRRAPQQRSVGSQNTANQNEFISPGGTSVGPASVGGLGSPSVTQRPEFTLDTDKELWLFWYSKNEPDLSLLPDELCQVEDGSWQQGVEYYIRILLFKALHNVIERTLLSQGYVRLGRWFTNPYQLQPGDDSIYPSPISNLKLNVLSQLKNGPTVASDIPCSSSQYGGSGLVPRATAKIPAFALHFLLQGENQVCTSIEVQRERPLYRLNCAVFNAAKSGQHNASVVLLPWGMIGELTGQELCESDRSEAAAVCSWNEWCHFYPLTELWNQHESTLFVDLPKMVIVSIDKVLFFWPTPLLMLQEDPGCMLSRTVSPVPQLPSSGSRIDTNCGEAKIPTSRRAATLLANADFDLTVSQEPVLEAELWDFKDRIGRVTCPNHEMLTVSSAVRKSSSTTDTLSKGAVKFFGATGPSSVDSPATTAGNLKQQQPSHNTEFTAFHRKCIPVDLSMNGSASNEHLHPVESCSSVTNWQHQQQAYNNPPSWLDTQLQQNVGRSVQTPLIPSIPTPLMPLVDVKLHPGSAVKTPTSENNPLLSKALDYASALRTPPEQMNAPPPLVEEQYNPPPPVIPIAPPPSVKMESVEKVSPPQQQQRFQPPLAQSTNVSPEKCFDTLVRPEVLGHELPRIKLCRPALPTSLEQLECEELERDFNSLQAAFREKGVIEGTLEALISDDLKSNLATLHWTESRERGHHIVDQLSAPLINDTIAAMDTAIQPPPSLPAPDPTLPDEILMISPPNSHETPVESGGSKQSQLYGVVRVPDTATVVPVAGVSLSTSLKHPHSLGGSSLLTGIDYTYLKILPTPPSLESVGEQSNVVPSEVFKSPVVASFIEANKFTPVDYEHLVNHQSNRPGVSGLGNGSGSSAASSAWALRRSLSQTTTYTSSGPSSKRAKVQHPNLQYKRSSNGPIMSNPFSATYSSSNMELLPASASAVSTNSYLGNNNYRGPGSVGPAVGIGSVGPGGQYAMSPAPGVRMGGPRTPGSISLQSPKSNSSMHLHNTTSGYGYPMSIPDHHQPQPPHHSQQSTLMLRADQRGAGGGKMGHLPPVSDKPETIMAHGLRLVLLLGDTFLNHYTDSAFDSCTLCACNMDLDGFEAGLFVTDSNSYSLASGASGSTIRGGPQKCCCGFSAAQVRYTSSKTGLFFEDERDVTGQWRGSHSRGASSDFDAQNLISNPNPDIDLMRLHALTGVTDTTSEISDWSSLDPVRATRWASRDNLAYTDFTDFCHRALEQAVTAIGESRVSVQRGFRSKKFVITRWGFGSGRSISVGDQTESLAGDIESVSLLSEILNQLQKSLEKPRGTWAAKHSVDGPLTWRSFHQKCLVLSALGTHSDEHGKDRPEPEPIAGLVSQFDRESIMFPPHAVKYWERMLLEPFSTARDVAYMVVAPETNQKVLTPSIVTFMKELSHQYESMRLGVHTAVRGLVADGIMRIDHKHALRVTNDREKIDSWFNLYEQSTASRMSVRARSYALVCRFLLCPLLIELYRKGTLFHKGSIGAMVANGAVPSDPADIDQNSTPSGHLNVPEEDAKKGPLVGIDGGQYGPTGSYGPENPPVIVIYMINPWPEEGERGRLALEKTFLEMLTDDKLPMQLKTSFQLRIISLEQLSQPVNTNALRELALGVFERARTLAINRVLHQGKILTSVGASKNIRPLIPLNTSYASRFQQLSNTLIAPKEAEFYALNSDVPHFSGVWNTPPFVLAENNTRDFASSANRESKNSSVLFVTYCLSEDQRWLLACVTDQIGLILDSAVLSIEVTGGERYRARRLSVISAAINKLWKYICDVVCSNSRPCRLVIGRFGRLGHGELKEWSRPLSKTALKAKSLELKDACGECRDLQSFNETPAILSACLVSLEAEPHLRLFASSVVHDDRASSSQSQGPNSKNNHVSTPEDASCTHILVFPTSAFTHHGSNPQTAGLGTSGSGNDAQLDDLADIFGFENIGGIDDTMGLTDIFMKTDGFGGPDDNDTGVDPLGIGLNDPVDGSASTMLPAERGVSSDELIQCQPLALGYMISTAPAPNLPSWFWSNCPANQFHCPVHLRAALHVTSGQVYQSDSELSSTRVSSHRNSAGTNTVPGGSSSSHSLESDTTTDVLRYVLEGYNALSWLNVNVDSGERISCLPVHMQALVRLYARIELMERGRVLVGARSGSSLLQCRNQTTPAPRSNQQQQQQQQRSESRHEFATPLSNVASQQGL